ncbi:ribose-phosphate diphosphokinase [Pontiella agarivorans]|uniref:Ribose-phosphate pyrophosphokinase n=1 Tax=Pontiella agarivorans TaxID=3038953 RepID=A0ABU5MXU8_9BACT|nr:ribose-phosphate pyrophosphokinase [Pontiella agarivorans]MDZ8119000.1 ribose-phosphate pyrophosphokinase [Pontiella agarivorans]
MKIISGTGHRVLAEQIAAAAGADLCDVDITRFPDGEVFVKIVENVRGDDLFIVQSVSVNPNEYLMELLIMIDAAKRASADRITAVLPFYGYARQDRKDQPRVPITAKLVANLLVAAGADRILCVDLHAQQIQGFFDIPVDHLYASPVIVKYLRSRDLDDLVVVSPDAGGLKMADAYSKLLDAGIALVGKQRKSATDVEANHLVGDVKGRNTLLVDDMTSTAGTLTAAAKLLEKAGAKSIRAAVSHSLLTEQGIDRLKGSPICELVTTDTVPQREWTSFKVTVLSVADTLAEAICRIHNDQSVSSLFRV